MAELIYCWSVAGVLLASGLLHIAAARLTERWMSKIPVVRGVGVFLGGAILVWALGP